MIKLRVGALAVNPLRSQDFHLISTVRGVSIADLGLTKTGELFYSTPENALPHWLATEIRRRPKRKKTQKLKIAGRLCYSRKPFRDFVPECEPRKGVSWRLTEFDAASHREDSTESSETLVHLSSTRSVIPKRLALRKGRIKKVTCVHGRDSREWSDVRPHPSTSDLAAASQPGGDARPSTGKFVSQPIMQANA